MTEAILSRRGLLLGALVLPLPLAPGAASTPPPAGGPAEIGAFVRVAADGSVTIVCPTAEIGQGATTGFAQVLAEELEVPWFAIRVVPSSAAPVYANPAFGAVATGGSTGIRARFDAIRRTGAAARTVLVAAAARRWGIAPDGLRAAAGAVHHPDGRVLTYGALAADAAALPLPSPEELRLKDPSSWHTIGRPLRRLDGPDKTRGRAVYGIDFRVPGMLYAAVRHAPEIGGRLAAFDTAAIAGRPGVRGVVPLGDAVAVVAEGYWAARAAAEALPVTWTPGPARDLDQAGIEAALLAALDTPGEVAHRDDAFAAARAGATRTFTADYETPYLDHARLEPSNATAHVRDGAVDVWSPTQSVSGVTLAVALALGVRPEAVVAHGLTAGGGFGRGGKFDLEIQAALVSRAVGAPVKVVWTRQEDIRRGFFRPASASRLTAHLGADGRLVGLEQKVAMQGLGDWFLSEILALGLSRERLAALLPPPVRPRLFPSGPDAQALDGTSDQAYRLPAREVSHVRLRLPVPVWSWRSVGHSNNAFAVECFLDEVAAAAGSDPLAFRRGLLAHSPRHLAVLDRLASAAGWGTPRPRGRGLGIAFHECYGGIGACAAEVEVSRDGVLAVRRLVLVGDVGRAVNPNLVAQQMEGGALFGLSAALTGRITVRDGAIEQSGFGDNMPLLLRDCPEVEVHIVESGRPVGGAGEFATPLPAPAVTNAIFAATGRRVRRLPLAQENLSWS